MRLRKSVSAKVKNESKLVNEVKSLVIIDGFEYELITDYRDAFKQEDFNGRYAEILNKYDYIVGDWGYGQLRLKGFFEDKNQKASFDTKISTLADYLYEYCNFGCAYFVLRKVGKVAAPVVESASVQAVEDNSAIAESAPSLEMPTNAFIPPAEVVVDVEQ